MADPTPATTIDVPLSLATAMVLAAPVPMLLLDGSFDVVVASRSFSDAFALDPLEILGRSVFELGTGEWNVPQLRSLLDATSTGAANISSYEMDLKQRDAARRLTLNAVKLAYDDRDRTRLLLTVVDVTDARAAEKLKDDLLREKNVLLQEMQHRIANSLQIIASVIMQTARSTLSKETKGYLEDTHHRVMSVAMLQRQLTITPAGQIDLHVYFTKLCESIAASMIGDASRLSIEATGDGSRVSSEISVSLGLIATELVINALKHAFPNDRAGKILVDYRSTGVDWRLTVQDDGVGMESKVEPPQAGLGTSIVQALSKQLQARVEVTDADPGTQVSVVHSGGGGAKPALAAEPI